MVSEFSIGSFEFQILIVIFPTKSQHFSVDTVPTFSIIPSSLKSHPDQHIQLLQGRVWVEPSSQANVPNDCCSWMAEDMFF